MVTALNPKYGFIKSASGEDFWFNTDFLFKKTSPVECNDTVWFIPSDPLPNAKNRRATDVVAKGTVLDGKLDRMTSKGFGFAVCPNQRGEIRQLFVFLGSGSWTSGVEIEFTVGENPRGIAGVQPRLKRAAATTSGQH